MGTSTILISFQLARERNLIMNLDRIPHKAYAAIMSEEVLTTRNQPLVDRAGPVLAANSEEIKRIKHPEENDQDRREDIWRDDGGQG